MELMEPHYVVAGPAEVGNLGTSFAYGILVPQGRFVVVRDGEYCDGGVGPSITVNKFFRTESGAEEACKKANEAFFARLREMEE